MEKLNSLELKSGVYIYTVDKIRKEKDIPFFVLPCTLISIPYKYICFNIRMEELWNKAININFYNFKRSHVKL